MVLGPIRVAYRERVTEPYRLKHVSHRDVGGQSFVSSSYDMQRDCIVASHVLGLALACLSEPLLVGYRGGAQCSASVSRRAKSRQFSV